MAPMGPHRASALRLAGALLGTCLAAALACAASSCSLDIADVRDAGASADAQPCTPTTCQASGADCGSIVDGCGGVLFCGLCSAGETCGADDPNVCGQGLCNKSGCPSNACGLISNKCDGVLDCGACRPPQTCGGGEEESRCGCTPVTCEEAGAECGYIPNACNPGQPIHCGTCSGDLACGGDGKPNRCGTGTCQPRLGCDEAGANCGTISDGCDGVIQCASCASGTCGGGGKPNVCGCIPPVCGNRDCGKLDNPCGADVVCGACDLPETCGGGGVPGQCGCIRRTCASIGANCGTSLDDGCGGKIACGPDKCPNKGDTCGGGGQEGVCGQYSCTPDCSWGGCDDGCGGTCQCGEY
jgi:hypothetical protein